MTALAGGVGGTAGISGHPAEVVCLSKRAEISCGLEDHILLLGGSMSLEKGLFLFVRGDLAVLDEVLLVAVWIQAIRELRFLSFA